MTWASAPWASVPWAAGPTVASTPNVSNAGGIASSEAFGVPVLSDAYGVAGAGGIASAEAFGAPTVSAPGAWTGYKLIGVANTGAAVTGLQQVIQLTAADVSFALWLSSGADIKITTADGLTTLPYWRRVWDATNSLGELWFKCDLAAAGTTNFRLYYGNASAVDTSSFDAVFQKLTTDGGAALALYHFDEGSGTPVDATGNTTATLVGSPSWAGSDLPGWSAFDSQGFSTGNSLSLNGTSQHITLGTLLNTIPSEYSIEFKFKWLGTPPGTDRRLFTKWTLFGGTSNGIDLWLEGSTGKVHFSTFSGATVEHRLSSIVGEAGLSSFVAGKVYRVVIQQSNTRGKEFWINGAIEGKDTAATSLPSSGSAAPATLGAYNNGSVSQWSNIQVDEFRVLNRWQTRNEIVANHQCRKYFADESRQANKLTRYGSNPLVATTPAAWDSRLAQEPAVWIDGSGKPRMLYTGWTGTPPTALGLATAASTFESAWAKVGTTPVLGNGQGGWANNACHAGVWVEGSVLHCFYADEVDPTANLRRATSDLNGVSWSGNTIAISKTQLAAVKSWANPRVFKVGSTYHLFVEARNAADTRWLLYHATNSSITNDGGWDFSGTNPLDSLSVYSGYGFSHLSITQIGSIYHAWYHWSTSPGDMPSVIGHAISKDLLNWLPDYANWVVLDNGFDGTVSGRQVDQIADPLMLEFGGNAKLVYDVSVNGGVGTDAKISLANYGGSVAQLVVDNPAPSLINLSTVTGAGDIASGEAFGVPTLTGQFAATVTNAGGVASSEAFGVPVVNSTIPGAVSVTNAGGIASAGAFGVPVLTSISVPVSAGARILIGSWT